MTTSTEREHWQKKRLYTPQELELALKVLEAVRGGAEVRQALRANPLPGGRGFLAKHTLVAAYRQMVEAGKWEEDPVLLAKIRMKPIRTLSGVTTITILTKPYPCPGECIFCPSEAGLPQSYLSDEPGARRGVENHFDPYLQVSSRLKALHEVGHPTDKIELLILGGSWSAYPSDYREWFVRRCFEALNEENPLDEQGSVPLAEVQARNVNGVHRNVGLVVETRPDLITLDGLLEFRRQGVTKIQIGVQSMDDNILMLNRRGHTAAETEEAVALVRAAGYKVLLHWMPNLLGATPESDREDFKRLWREGGLQPDELKIYPCQLLESAELYRYWQAGEYQPYSEETLISLIADVKLDVPRFCRINRVIRDIPSPLVVEGNRNTSLRQDVALLLQQRGQECQCIRCREIRYGKVDPGSLKLTDQVYLAGQAEEHFLSFNTPDDKIVGFLRLSLPLVENTPAIPDLQQAAIIREVHVYGQSLEVGSEQAGAAQHIGLGTQLLLEAERIARDRDYEGLAVISAVGTRTYYADRGFKLGELYMRKSLE
ncbi:MAG TPA: tRNA uridine(34) 5-carboxymethylaminomethyl modification radical SAM/GNAT enzyme Elp3 [Anaerolineaceae bacterium]|nr:tRNA uridine(34) 5-carboxymethylaminomethyl modification radical SAM/GNAT enzyme Elp3 [Anaerolineaceae bacterium]